MKRDKFLINVVSNVIIAVSVFGLFMGSIFSTNATVVSKLNKDIIYRGNTEEKTISLMFNVYQGDEYIDGILNELKKYKATATFFVGGIYASRHNETIKKIADSDNEIGNHGYTHKDHKSLDYKRNVEEIKQCYNQLETLKAKQTKLFAPPSGSYGNQMIKACEDLDYKIIMWTRDTIDWKEKDANVILSRATQKVQNGYLILMHPTKATLEALPKVLAYYAQNGYKAVTVSKNIAPTPH